MNDAQTTAAPDAAGTPLSQIETPPAPDSPAAMVEHRFLEAFTGYSKYVAEWAVRKRFHTPGESRNVGEIIALMHSELSEGLEADRKGRPADDKVPQFDGLTAELADTVIRIMNFAGEERLPVGAAIIAKMRMNETRPPKHGKAY